MENITAEKAAKEELAQQKNLLYKLYNGVPCGILDYLVTDGELHMANFNDTAWRLSGYEDRGDFQKACEARRLGSMIHPDDLPQVLDKLHGAIALGDTATVECRVERKDHSFFWSEIRLQSYVNGDTIMLQSVIMDIGDRREQETQKYSRILYSIFDEVFLWDYQENSCQVIRGAGPRARVGETHNSHMETNEAWIEKYVLSEDREGLREFIRHSHLQRVCAGDTIPFIDYRVLLPNGETVLTRSSAFSVDDSRYMICCRNVTKQKQAEKQAREIAVLQAKLEEQERYRIIVEQTGAAVIEWNHDTGEFFHSGTYDNYEMSRCAPEDLLRNQAKLTTVHEEDIPQLKRFFMESKSGKTSAEAALRLRMTDGNFRWTRMRGEFLFDASGVPRRTIGTLTDIDSEMRTKETLRQTNARLENIIANIPAGIIIYRIQGDATAIPLYISQHACQIIGLTREECEGRIAAGEPIDFIPQMSAVLLGQLKGTKAREPVSLPRVQARRKDGSRIWLRLTCSLVEEEKELPICYLTLSDVSHLVEAEQAADSVKELYQLLIESTETITLDYSVPQDLLRISFVGQNNIREERQIARYMTCLQGGESHVVPSSRPELTRVMQSALHRESHGELDLQARGPDGGEHWYHMKFLSLSREGAVYRLVGRADNIDGIYHSQKAKLELALIDRATGLRSKDSARAAVEEKLYSRPQEQLDAMLFLDIDNFKRVNDTDGHLEGDRMLARVAEILKKSFRTTDVVARFGGDEFLIYMVAPESRQAVLDKAQRILEDVRAISTDKSAVLGCSIGITEVKGDMRDFDTVFYRVDRAMYRAKQRGKNCFAVG